MLITKRQIIDPATGAVVGEFVNGDTLYNSQHPAGFTIGVVFSDKLRAVQFAVDGQSPVTQMAQPYLINDKHPLKPLNLPVGSHRIGVIVDGVALPDITFNLAASPPPPPTPTPVRRARIGTNLNGLTNPLWNAAEMALFQASYKDVGFNAGARLWIELSELRRLGPVPYGSQAKTLHDAGIPIFAQIQYGPLFKVYNLSDQTLFRNFFLANPWITVASMGNEIDSRGYFNDTNQALAAFTHFLQPIRGNTKLLAPSFVHGLGNLQAYVAGGFAAGTDGVDLHVYGSLSATKTAMTAYTTWCAGKGLKAYSSEFGIEQDPPLDAATWSNQQDQLIASILPQDVTAYQYPAFPIAGKLYDATFLDATLRPRQPYYNGYKSVLTPTISPA